MPVLPGYRYVGPGNKLNNGEPINDTDRAARKHDFAYQRLLSLGKKAYTQWSQADKEFLEEIGPNTDYGAYISRGVFNVKRYLAKAGIIGTIMGDVTPMRGGNKRRRLNNQDRLNREDEEDEIIEDNQLAIQAPDTVPMRAIAMNMDNDGPTDGKNDIMGGGGPGSAMINNSGKGVLRKETYTFSRTRKWKFDTAPENYTIVSTTKKPNDIYPLNNVQTTYDWHILPNNNLALYWSASDMAQIFGRPGLVRWRPTNLRIKVFGSRMAFDQPQNATALTSIDRPIWISYVDKHNLFMNQSTEPETNSVNGTANAAFGPPLQSFNAQWSINPKADLHEYAGTFPGTSGRTVGPVSLTTPLSLFRLRDWAPGVSQREDTAAVVTPGTSPESLLVTYTGGTVENSIPSFYKEVESIGDWQMHEPGSSLEWSYDPQCPPLNVVVPGYIDNYTNTNISHMPGAINLTATTPTGAPAQFNLQNNIDYFPWNTNAILHNISKSVYEQYNDPSSRMQVPVILLKIPAQTNSLGGVIAARCDFYATYEMDVECEFKTYATSRGAERNVVRNSRVVMNGGTLDQFDVIDYPHTGPVYKLLKSSADINGSRPLLTPRFVPGTI